MRPLGSSPISAARSTWPGGGALLSRVVAATSSAEPLIVTVPCGLRDRPLIAVLASTFRLRQTVPPASSASDPASAAVIVVMVSSLSFAVSYCPMLSTFAGPTTSASDFTVRRPASSSVAWPFNVAGLRSSRAIGLSGRPGAIADTSTVRAVAPCSRCQLAPPVELIASPADTVSDPVPSSRPPFATSLKDTRSRSGRPSSAATTPPCVVSSAVIVPSTFSGSRLNPRSAVTFPAGPSVRVMSTLSLLGACAASRAEPAIFQCESTPPEAAARCRSSTVRPPRSISSGRLKPPPDEDDDGVSSAIGLRSTSTLRAATASMRRRPVNIDRNDQRACASSTVSQTPCLSRISTLAICMSVGTNPVMPVTSSDEEEIALASNCLPGGVWRPPNSAAAVTTMPPAVQPMIRRARIRRPARG